MAILMGMMAKRNEMPGTNPDQTGNPSPPEFRNNMLTEEQQSGIPARYRWHPIGARYVGDSKMKTSQLPPMLNR